MKTSPFNYSLEKSQRGFTLIELIVVVAIIAMLTAVVVSNLSVSRNKGTNAHLRTTLAQMRTQANLYFNDNGNFGTVAGGCGTANTVFFDTKFTAIKLSLESTSGATATCVNSTTGLGSWAVLIPSKPEGVNNYLCADSIGALKAYASAPSIAGAVCP
jgi:prepilin-type N-terminal cleavage/methylation domain-containing protein